MEKEKEKEKEGEKKGNEMFVFGLRMGYGKRGDG